MNNMSLNVKRLSDISAQSIGRYQTGFDELNYIYGHTTYPNKQVIWGMPVGKISLWSGSSGIGKSRLCIDVAKHQARLITDPRFKILYFQTESTLEDFAGWAKDTNNYSNFYCSGENRIDEIIKIIYEIKPHIVFIDSVNEVNEFENGNKQEARRLIQGIIDSNGNFVRPGLKKVCSDLSCHVVLLGQLNQDGKTIKGGTSLPHLVDIALDLIPLHNKEYNEDIPEHFVVQVGVKHRFGKKDSHGIFKHEDFGIIETSCRRELDPLWCSSHGVRWLNAEEREIATDNILKEELRKMLGKPLAQDQVNDKVNKGSLLDCLNEKVGNFFGL